MRAAHIKAATVAHDRSGRIRAVAPVDAGAAASAVRVREGRDDAIESDVLRRIECSAGEDGRSRISDDIQRAGQLRNISGHIRRVGLDLNAAVRQSIRWRNVPVTTRCGGRRNRIDARKHRHGTARFRSALERRLVIVRDVIAVAQSRVARIRHVGRARRCGRGGVDRN